MVVKAGFNIRLTSDVENGIHDWYMIVFWNRIGNLLDRQSILRFVNFGWQLIFRISISLLIDLKKKILGIQVENVNSRETKSRSSNILWYYDKMKNETIRVHPFRFDINVCFLIMDIHWQSILELSISLHFCPPITGYPILLKKSSILLIDDSIAWY
jgi:hypothetical protein